MIDIDTPPGSVLNKPVYRVILSRYPQISLFERVSGPQDWDGISNEQAARFDAFDSQWSQIADYLKDRLIVIDNASFDGSILLDHVCRYVLPMPPIQGLFCCQKAAFPWARAMNLPCSHRGHSLDTLSKTLGVEDLGVKKDGVHGAKIGSQQTARFSELMRLYGLQR